uniref:Capsular polysaccharide export protein n=1 Tax=Candidatus Kentrum sp. FM TaxID=2126340 RepID=A0A450RYY2_9GAMM|nr:MAG: capsular polysaccharide export protein [Candidatus Kentron sp. FM]VFJ57574.1 MAG: capsular polysaccharide export protein [Candidatus Kentron sp. FM]VFK06579.1 MAG: capsular polysaccharide export protein [Candidatus Kentron sp. FM]
MNFHAGDWFYYPRGAFHYRGAMEDWPAWFAALIDRLDIQVVLLFGDCRPIHRAAHTIALEHGLEIGVFEEGYIRPDYVTLEHLGANAHSRLPRHPDLFRTEPSSVPERIPVGNTYWAMVWHGGWYFGVGSLGNLFISRSALQMDRVLRALY